MRVRPSTPADVESFAGRPLGGVWFGMSAVDAEDQAVGLGLITWDDAGRSWAWFNARERLPAVLMHRTARRVLAWLAKTGQTSLNVYCDERVPGAPTWLLRLGFEPGPDGIWSKPLD